jgi:DDE superfamily endonuclease
MNMTKLAGAVVARRRRAAAAALIIYFISPWRRYMRGPNYPRRCWKFNEHVGSLSSRQFRRMYRMTLDNFNDLCAGVENHRIQSGRRKGRHAVDAKLSMTLRWLAGGSYLDISFAHCVSTSAFFHVLDETICDLDVALSLEFLFRDVEYLERVSAGFTRGKSPISGCVGCIDGIAIRIVEPCVGTTANPSTYFNRKGFFALNVQAMCDSDYRFTFASAVCPGSTHDSTAYAVSSMAGLLSRTGDDTLLPTYWIAVDEAYVCGERIITPWPGRSLSQSRDCFNYWQSSARIHIEQAFGMLIGRWGIFWRPLRTTVDKAAQIVLVCMKLHNFIVDDGNIDIPLPGVIDFGSHTQSPDYRVHEQDQADANDALHRRRRDLEASELRSYQTEEIDDLGLSRPAIF